MPIKTRPLQVSDLTERDKARFRLLFDGAPQDGCVEVKPAKTNGYGDFRVGGVVHRTHRVSYVMFVGPIPNGLLVCHSCDNRACINPAHLWLGTPAENSQDASRKGRMRGTKKGRLRKPSKYGRPMVRKIKAGKLSARDAMRRHGISSAHFYRIKAGIQRQND